MRWMSYNLAVARFTRLHSPSQAMWPPRPPQLLPPPAATPGVCRNARHPAATAAAAGPEPGTRLVRPPTRRRRAQVPLHGVEARHGGGRAAQRARSTRARRPCSAAQRAQGVPGSPPLNSLPRSQAAAYGSASAARHRGPLACNRAALPGSAARSGACQTSTMQAATSAAGDTRCAARQ